MKNLRYEFMKSKSVIIFSISLFRMNNTAEHPLGDINSTTYKPNIIAHVTESPASLGAMDPLSHVGDGIFLQTKTAQGIAGAFVWVALFLTCQQVSSISIIFLKIFFYFIFKSIYSLNVIEKKNNIYSYIYLAFKIEHIRQQYYYCITSFIVNQ